MVRMRTPAGMPAGVAAFARALAYVLAVPGLPGEHRVCQTGGSGRFRARSDDRESFVTIITNAAAFTFSTWLCLGGLGIMRLAV